MDGTAPSIAKVALSILPSFGFAQPQEMTGAINVTALKFGHRKTNIVRGAPQIDLSQIDIPFDVAATSATGDAGKSETVSRVHSKVYN
jgi:hypothetical protein